MKRFLTFAIAVVAFMTFSVQVMRGNESLRPEPPLSAQFEWDTYPNGMLLVAYDTDWNGRPDFFTLRIITHTFWSTEPCMTVAVQYSGSPVFCVDSETIHPVFVTTRHPLFYSGDSNEDGLWDWVYKDVSEDGVNGNEEFYASPSGKFPLILTPEPVS